MRKRIVSFFRQLKAEQKGAVFTMVAAAIFGITGVGALVVDIGSILYWQRVLQTTADAAALAGAQDIGVGGTPIATAISYSAVAGNKNAHAHFSATMINGYPQLKCFTTIGLACTTNQTPATAANGIQVQEQAAVRLYFARIFGLASINITATSTAAASGGVPIPLNVAFVLDTTASMNNPATDKSCKSSALNCALNGIQVLLGELWPCQQSQTCTTLGATPVDGASLFVFPPVTNSNQAALDISCTSPTISPSYSGVSNTTNSATPTTSPTVHLTTSTTTQTAFNTGSWAVVTDVTPTNAATPAGTATLHFKSGTITTAVATALVVRRSRI
jgi:hypothetical protein